MPGNSLITIADTVVLCPGNRRRVFPVLTSAVAIPAALLIAAGASARPPVLSRPAGSRRSSSPPRTGRASPLRSQPQHQVSPIEAGPGIEQSGPTLTALVASRSRVRTLPPGVGIERGLQVRTILVGRAISALPGDHQHRRCAAGQPALAPSGLAIDVMIPNYDTPAGKTLGIGSSPSCSRTPSGSASTT